MNVSNKLSCLCVPKNFFEVIGQITFQQAVKTFLPPNRNAQAHTTCRSSTSSSVPKMVRLLRVSTCWCYSHTSHIICGDDGDTETSTRETYIGSERERTSTWWERTRPREERICSNLLSFFFAKLSSTRRIVVERRQDKNNKVELRANAVHPHHRHRRRCRLAQVTFWALISRFFSYCFGCLIT